MPEPLGIQRLEELNGQDGRCWECLGSGRAWYDNGGEAEVEPCPTCNGRGVIPRRWYTE